MSAIGRPIWKPELAPFMVRLPIGVYLLAFGYMKFQDMPGFLESFKKIGLMHEHFALPIAVLLPYIELLMGVFLIFGLWTTLAAVVSGLVFLFYIFLFGGMFEMDPETKRHTWIFIKDIFLLSGCLSLLSSGAGAFSIDRFRQNG